MVAWLPSVVRRLDEERVEVTDVSMSRRVFDDQPSHTVDLGIVAPRLLGQRITIRAYNSEKQFIGCVQFSQVEGEVTCRRNEIVGGA